MKSVYYITLIFSMMFYPLFPVENPVPAGLAVLREGTIPVKGLRFFETNRIPALFGRYESSGGYSVSVWAVNEALFFDPFKWTSEKKGNFEVQSLRDGERNRVWIVKREIPMRQELTSVSVWYFAAEFPDTVPESFCTVFYDALIARTEFFFSSARRYSDLSFPAAIAAAGK